MRKYLIVVLSVIGLNANGQTIPGASQQPKWVFPMYFEEYGGERDTVYMGYDPIATFVRDAVSAKAEKSIVSIKMR